MTRTSVRNGLLAALMVSGTTTASAAVGLAGSPASMVHQHAIAVEEKYTFLRTPLEVRRLVSNGELVAVTPGPDVTLAGVSFPYTRPEVRAFILRFAHDYRDSTGAPLTVTSLTRPEALQPSNAHPLSVHPAGMAVDFRVPATAAERAYLERSLLALESSGMLDVTREHTPAHYHVAIFATPTLAWVASRNAVDPMTVPRATRTVTTEPARRELSRVPAGLHVDSLDESRLPMFILAMAGLLGMATLLLHAPSGARRHR